MKSLVLCLSSQVPCVLRKSVWLCHGLLLSRNLESYKITNMIKICFNNQTLKYILKYKIC